MPHDDLPPCGLSDNFKDACGFVEENRIFVLEVLSVLPPGLREAFAWEAAGHQDTPRS